MRCREETNPGGLNVAGEQEELFCNEPLRSTSQCRTDALSRGKCATRRPALIWWRKPRRQIQAVGRIHPELGSMAIEVSRPASSRDLWHNVMVVQVAPTMQITGNPPRDFFASKRAASGDFHLIPNCLTRVPGLALRVLGIR